MSDETLVRLRYKPEIIGEKEIRDSWVNLTTWFEKTLVKLGESIPEQVGKTMGELYGVVGTNYDDLTKSFGKTAQSAIVDSIGPYFRGEMDKVEDIWHTAWDSMELAAGDKNRLIRVSAGLLFITVMVINNKPHPDCDSGGDSALSPIITRPADAYHQPAVFCVTA